jgi:hypothetical protein
MALPPRSLLLCLARWLYCVLAFAGGTAFSQSMTCVTSARALVTPLVSYLAEDVKVSRNYGSGMNAVFLDDNYLNPMQASYPAYAAALSNGVMAGRRSGKPTALLFRELLRPARRRFIETHQRYTIENVANSNQDRMYTKVDVSQYSEFRSQNRSHFREKEQTHETLSGAKLTLGYFDGSSYQCAELRVSKIAAADAFERFDRVTEPTCALSPKEKLNELIESIRVFYLAQLTENGTGTYGDALIRSGYALAFGKKFPPLDGLDLMALTYSKEDFHSTLVKHLSEHQALP